ncbi:MAG: hypothetical protein KDD53_00760 [Bdellovibrionales bacterium]|nr:hypothetical protein [Bdellovibrionales bacterium]
MLEGPHRVEKVPDNVDALLKGTRHALGFDPVEAFTRESKSFGFEIVPQSDCLELSRQHRSRIEEFLFDLDQSEFDLPCHDFDRISSASPTIEVLAAAVKTKGEIHKVDFLVVITDPNGRYIMVREGVPPQTTTDFAAIVIGFKGNTLGGELGEYSDHYLLVRAASGREILETHQIEAPPGIVKADLETYVHAEASNALRERLFCFEITRVIPQVDPVVSSEDRLRCSFLCEHSQGVSLAHLELDGGGFRSAKYLRNDADLMIRELPLHERDGYSTGKPDFRLGFEVYARDSHLTLTDMVSAQRTYEALVAKWAKAMLVDNFPDKHKLHCKLRDLAHNTPQISLAVEISYDGRHVFFDQATGRFFPSEEPIITVLRAPVSPDMLTPEISFPLFSAEAYKEDIRRLLVAPRESITGHILASLCQHPTQSWSVSAKTLTGKFGDNEHRVMAMDESEASVFCLEPYESGNTIIIAPDLKPEARFKFEGDWTHYE